MNQEYINAVLEGDLTAIRSYITSAIREDPTFSTKKVAKYIEFALDKGIVLFEPYEDTPCETTVPEDQDQWDQRLFYDKVEDLRLNFAYHERIEVIQKIGKKVYGDDDSFSSAPEDHRSERKNKVAPLLVAAIAVAIVLGVVAFLLLR